MSSDSRLLEAEDLYRLRFIGEPRISPDGQRVLFSLTHADKDDNDYRAHLWLINGDGSGKPLQFTNGTGKDSDPRWSPDGSLIAFVSTRSGHSEIWIIPADGGEARRLTHTPHGATMPRWSPDGRAILFSAKLDSDDPPLGSRPFESDEERKERKEKERKKKTEEPRRFSRLHYKSDGQGLWEGRYSHLWVVALDEDGDADGDPRQLTSGDFDDLDAAWSPDGRQIAFVSRRTDVEDRQLITDLFLVPAEGGEAVQLTGALGGVTAPSWSPDGRHIAYVGHERTGEAGFASNTKIFLLDFAPDGGTFEERREVTERIDRPVGSHVMSDLRAGLEPEPPIWTADSAALLSTVSDWGRTELWRFPLDGGEPQQVLGGDRQILNISYSPTGVLAFTANDPLLPGDLYSVRLTEDGRLEGYEMRLTEVNKKLLGELALATTEELRFEGPGCELQGWVMKPPRFRQGEQYPAVMEIHGGPHLLYGFAFMHEFQLLAAQGWVVFFMNPRGGQGYGQDFAEAINGHWGTPDYEDLMYGADVLLEQGYVDPARFGVTGGSYGGYMTAWIVGHTNRFKVAIAQRSVTNLISMYGSSDIGWALLDWEFGELFGDADAYKRYWEASPLAYAPNVETPLLITHSEEDLRCNIEQAEELYVALKRLGKEVELVRYPGASHGLSRNGKPKMRIHRLDVMLDWLTRYLGSDLESATP